MGELKKHVKTIKPYFPKKKICQRLVASRLWEDLVWGKSVGWMPSFSFYIMAAIGAVAVAISCGFSAQHFEGGAAPGGGSGAR